MAGSRATPLDSITLDGEPLAGRAELHTEVRSNTFRAWWIIVHDIDPFQFAVPGSEHQVELVAGGNTYTAAVFQEGVSGRGTRGTVRFRGAAALDGYDWGALGA
jgi:hypothetical protein